ncbi:MAG: 16S rRNA (guanine(527)-N(7))-methyltransferase RsmG [Geminicoccaceae bacterium]
MPAAVREALSVSRETASRLEAYVACLLRWQRTINLVAPSTLAAVWTRHVLDSGQLWRSWPEGARVHVDLGSGGGLPGLVLAIMGATGTHLVESDRRKAAFLREAARAAGATVTVHAARIEEAPALVADVITARALAPLPELLRLGRRFAGPATVWLLPKGRGAAEELTAARAIGTMQADLLPSLTDPEGRIVRLREVALG